jgi:hypothetical protein
MDPRVFAQLCNEAYSCEPDLEHKSARLILRDTEYGRCAAFRGTDDGASALTDLEFIPCVVRMLGLVHLGFWEALDGIYDAVIPEKPIILTGHSLGGALALLLAARMTLDGAPPKAVFTFGAPRISIGGRARLVLQNVPILMFRHGIDIVPEVPPGFEHPAVLTEIGVAGEPIADHAIARYLAALS